jgi:hypothetical protein
MGKMKEIAMMIEDNEVDTLSLMIDLAKRNKRSGVYFRGKSLTFEEANNMLNFALDEVNKVRRSEQPPK